MCVHVCVCVCVCVWLLSHDCDHASLQGTATLPLVLASFSLNGTFLGLEEGVDLLSQRILLCRDNPSRHQAAWRVGVQYRTTVS